MRLWTHTIIALLIITTSGLNLHAVAQRSKRIAQEEVEQANRRRMEVNNGLIEESVSKTRRLIDEQQESVRKTNEQVKTLADRFTEANPGSSPETSNRAALAVITVADSDFTIKAIMEWLYIESRFCYHETSPVDARGIAQIQPRTAEWIADGQAHLPWDESQMYDPEYGIRLGVAHLKWLLKHYDGDKDMAYSAYNMGMAGAESFRDNQRARGVQVASRGEYSRLIRKRAGEID